MISLNKSAKVAGLLYIVASVIGVVRLLYVPSTLIVHDNPAVTANNIATHELLFRVGIFSYLVSSALFIFVTLALYRLLSRVDKPLAVLMVILGSLMPVPIFFVNSATDVATLLFVRGANFLSMFDAAQRDGFAMLSLSLHHGLDMANGIFWGLWLVPFGLLVYKSKFLPRLLGVWLIIACFAYLAQSFAYFLFPRYEDLMFSLGSPLRLGELATMFWLVIMGAKEPRAPHL